jgi:alpha 1,6-mannosyltransferase
MLFVCFGPGQHRFPHSRYGFKLRGHSTKELPGYSSDDLVFTEAGNTLPNIPPRIWQFYTPLKPGGISSDFLASWSLRCPNYLHSVIDEAGSRALMSSLASMPGGRFRGALEIFDHLDRVVLRADLIRFVLLALRGGIYSDTDVEMVQPLSAWVPDEWKAHARLIVGLEADQEQPIPETTYPVQFATWTIAGAPGHPLFYHMIERILNNLRA